MLKSTEDFSTRDTHLKAGSTSGPFCDNAVNYVYSANGFLLRSRDSVVGIATGYGLDDRRVGFRVPVGSRIFSSQCRLDRLWVHPISYSMGTGDSLNGSKAAGA
jgi:hypothetical protein